MRRMAMGQFHPQAQVSRAHEVGAVDVQALQKEAVAGPRAAGISLCDGQDMHVWGIIVLMMIVVASVVVVWTPNVAANDLPRAKGQPFGSVHHALEEHLDTPQLEQLLQTGRWLCSSSSSGGDVWHKTLHPAGRHSGHVHGPPLAWHQSSSRR